MNGIRMLTSLLVVGALLVLVVGSGQAQAPEPPGQELTAAPLGAAFTYQGQLNKGGGR